MEIYFRISGGYGHHLRDILTKTTFVSGFRLIYHEFSQQGTNQIQVISSSAQNQLILKQLEEDLDNFDSSKHSKRLLHCMSFNIKRVVYRSLTLLIAALDRWNSIYQSPCSCYDVIKALKEIELDLDAVSISCEVRLRAYCLEGKQEDMSQKSSL